MIRFTVRALLELLSKQGDGISYEQMSNVLCKQIIHTCTLWQTYHKNHISCVHTYLLFWVFQTPLCCRQLLYHCSLCWPGNSRWKSSVIWELQNGHPSVAKTYKVKLVRRLRRQGKTTKSETPDRDRHTPLILSPLPSCHLQMPRWYSCDYPTLTAYHDRYKTKQPGRTIYKQVFGYELISVEHQPPTRIGQMTDNWS